MPKFRRVQPDQNDQDDALAVRRRIGERIKNRRRELQMEQAELAAAMGASQAMMSKYESGAVAMRMEELPRLAQALGVSVSYFFAETAAIKSGGIDWREIEDGLIADWRCLPDWMRINIAGEIHVRAQGAEELRARGSRMAGDIGLLTGVEGTTA